ncbi:MAG: iron-containing alcohol dehydrogenase [Mycoplasmatales bacterium]
MNNFILENRPKIFFGKNQIQNLEKEVLLYKNILLVYGQGSIKKNGIYSEVKNQLINKNIIDLPGITPNPRITDVKKGIKLCQEHDVDFILAIGGGSVIDCAKAIALGACHEENIWDIIVKKCEVNKALPLGTIPTMIATGSETNDIFVILNDEINLKRSLKTGYTYPKFTIMDPTYTLTINRRQTVNGIVDTLSHLLEQYINTDTNEIIDHQILTMFKDMLSIGEQLINNLDNYELRAKHMYLAMTGYNGDYRTIVGGDWACHGMDYGLASKFNNYHGEGLAIIMPNWLEYVSNNYDNTTKVKSLLQGAFGQSDVFQNIMNFRNYLNKIGAPLKYSEIQDKEIEITPEILTEMIHKAQFTKPLGGTIPLTEADIKKIYLMGE